MELVVSAAASAIGGAIAPGIVAFGMTGAQLGWMAGGLLASAFAPAQKSSGPRLADLTVSSSAYGTPIPFIIGHPRVAGQIIWASQIREIATTTKQGKGGGSKYTSYTYEVDLLYKVSDNILAGVRKIWRSGELVWSADENSDIKTLANSGRTDYWNRMTFYGGGPTQTPDPTYEADVGADRALAYRGCGTIMFQSVQLGSSGQIPNLTFEVLSDGVDGARGFYYDLASGKEMQDYPVLGDAEAPKEHTIVKFGTSSFHYDGVTLTDADLGAEHEAYLLSRWPGAGDFTMEAWVYPTQFGVAQKFFWMGDKDGIISLAGLGITTDGHLDLHVYGPTYAYPLIGHTGNHTPHPLPLVLNTWNHVALRRKDGNKWFLISRGIMHPVLWEYRDSGVVYRDVDYFDTYYGAGVTPTAGFIANVNSGPDLYLDQVRYSLRDMYSHYDSPTGKLPLDDQDVKFHMEFDDYPVVERSEVPLHEAVRRICVRAGMSESKFDVTALETITRPVRAMAASQVATAREALETLAGTFFFTCTVSDKVYFRPMGGSALATISHLDLSAYMGSDQPERQPSLRKANDLEIPALTSMTYMSMDSDYQSNTQESDRLLTDQESKSSIQVPLAFHDAEAKEVVNVINTMRAISAVGGTVTVGLKYAKYEPGDVVLLTDEEGSTYRVRIERKHEADNVFTWDVLLDDATVLSQLGITSQGIPPQTEVLGVPSTDVSVLDIPILRDADNYAGAYAAVVGRSSEWKSAGLYSSKDNLSYDLEYVVTDQTAVGTTESILQDFSGGSAFDEMSSVVVNVRGAQLYSYTRSQVLNGLAPGYLIGNEILYARTATLISTEKYRLSSMLRGRRGTEWAKTSHSVGERVVLLSSSGLRFLTVENSDLGKSRYYKAVSSGLRLTAVPATVAEVNGVALKPFAPVHVRANRVTTDTIITFFRRTRLTARFGGVLGSSVPLGEDSESYVVEVYEDSTFTTLKRTLTANSPSVTYTSAQQVADFGSNQATLYLKIYMVSAAVGRGYPAQVTI